MTYIGASAEGAEMTTFSAPPLICACALSMVVKTPVDSQTISAPTEPQPISKLKGKKESDSVRVISIGTNVQMK